MGSYLPRRAPQSLQAGTPERGWFRRCAPSLHAQQSLNCPAPPPPPPASSLTPANSGLCARAAGLGPVLLCRTPSCHWGLPPWRKWTGATGESRGAGRVAGADLPEVPTFMLGLEGLQAEGTARLKAPHDKGLGRFPRVTEATLSLSQPGLPYRTHRLRQDTHSPVRRLEAGGQGQGNSAFAVS